MEEIQYSQLKEEEEDDEYWLTDSDMVAAQKLMQLSDGINSSISTKIVNKQENTTDFDDDDDEEVDQVFCQRLESTSDYVSDGQISSSNSRLSDRAVAEINEEIFGTDFQDDEVCDVDDRPNKLPHKIKKRRYLSLASIYRKTEPIDDEDVDYTNPSKKKKKIEYDDDDGDDRRRHQEEVLLLKKKTLKGFIR